MTFEIEKIVIKGKLPSMCFMCPFAAKYKQGTSICAAKYNTRKQNNHHKYFIDPAAEPPKWCPLVENKE